VSAVQASVVLLDYELQHTDKVLFAAGVLREPRLPEMFYAGCREDATHLRVREVEGCGLMGRPGLQVGDAFARWRFTWVKRLQASSYCIFHLFPFVDFPVGDLCARPRVLTSYRIFYGLGGDKNCPPLITKCEGDWELTQESGK
jgi:hypothetical protein